MRFSVFLHPSNKFLLAKASLSEYLFLEIKQSFRPGYKIWYGREKITLLVNIPGSLLVLGICFREVGVGASGHEGVVVQSLLSLGLPPYQLWSSWGPVPFGSELISVGAWLIVTQNTGISHFGLSSECVFQGAGKGTHRYTSRPQWASSVRPCAASSALIWNHSAWRVFLLYTRNTYVDPLPSHVPVCSPSYPGDFLWFCE